MMVRNGFTNDSRVEKEARTLLGAGYAVTVVCEARPGLALRETRQGVEVVRVPRPHDRIPVVRFIQYRRAFIQALRSARPTVLHAHDLNTLDEVATVASQLRIPFVYDSHEFWLARPRRKHSHAYFGVMQRWHGAIERKHIRRAGAVLTVSPRIASALESRYRLRRTYTVPNYPELPADSAVRSLRELTDPPLPGDVPVVLHIGLFMADRGVEQLMQAMREVPEAHLVLLGPGPRAAEAVCLATSLGLAGRVHPLPTVPPDEIIRYARSATIGVTPLIGSGLNHQFALPNKLFQYMAAGLPVVAADLPEMGAMVRESGAGLTVDSRRPAEIAAAISTLLAQPALMAEMGKRGEQAVREKYNWETSARVLMAAYAGLADDRAGR